ncbi:MAG: 3-phosphoshikimate 1-carboxyvinyltransferase [Myxococcota bacterium]
MKTLRIRGPARLAGRVLAPPDKSIAHRALMMAAVAEGESIIRPHRPGLDVRSTARVLSELGVRIHVSNDEARVQGVEHPKNFRPSPGPLDCGNSGTTIRLLAGLLSARPGSVVLDGDTSLRRRPMERLRPLERMGARLTAASKPQGPRAPFEVLTPPFAVEGATHLTGATHRLEVASAQVKSALLLAGVFSKGKTTVIEPKLSRDHTERMLRQLGVEIRSGPVTEGLDAYRHELCPGDGPWSGRIFHVAPDLSSAAFLLGAGWVTQSPGLAVGAGLNPTRSGIFEVFESLGADIRYEGTPTSESGEPWTFVSVSRSDHDAGPVSLSGGPVLRALDELPLVMGMLAFHDQPSRLRDARELRVKESDRLAAMADVLTAFGVEVQLKDDGMDILPREMRPARINPRGDHRIAMTAAVMGLGLSGWTEVEDPDCIAVSYPDFVRDLQILGADVEVVDH